MKMETLKQQILTAKGDVPAELVLKNARVINVFTNEIEQADVAICQGVILGVLLLSKTCVLPPEILFWVYIAIQPKAFATELARMIAAKMGHSQRIIKLNTGLRRNR